MQPPASDKGTQSKRTIDASSMLMVSAQQSAHLSACRWTARSAPIGRNFRGAVQRDPDLPEPGQNPTDHFDAPIKLVTVGSGARRKIEDFHISHSACSLLIQHADPDRDCRAEPDLLRC